MNFSINETALVRNQLFLSYVNDGDGLIVENLSGKGKEEIRFLGIDAPELKLQLVPEPVHPTHFLKLHLSQFSKRLYQQVSHQ